ncbi:MAG: hypothetical protein OEY99_02825 [Aigarchaeota archaeon]|nr:hypothetical protein [Aigarchaeota archaeon]
MIRARLPCPHCGKAIKFNVVREKSKHLKLIENTRAYMEKVIDERERFKEDLRKFGESLDTLSTKVLEKRLRSYEQTINEVRKELERLQRKRIPRENRTIINCPFKRCNKEILMIKRDRTIKLSRLTQNRSIESTSVV